SMRGGRNAAGSQRLRRAPSTNQISASPTAPSLYSDLLATFQHLIHKTATNSPADTYLSSESKRHFSAPAHDERVNSSNEQWFSGISSATFSVPCGLTSFGHSSQCSGLRGALFPSC